MNKEIELLNKKIEAQDKIINTQALEIARLKEEKAKAIECIKICGININTPDEDIVIRKVLKNILEILGDKENE